MNAPEVERTSVMPGAKRTRRYGSFFVPLAPQHAFDLFTAEGERLWVPEWEPEILGGWPQEPGLVFVTAAGKLRTIWTVVESNRATLRHRYSRVTPGAHAGLVEVRLRSERHGSRVHVSYDLTSLPGAARDVLTSYSEPFFAEMLEEWSTLLHACVNRARNQAKAMPNLPVRAHAEPVG